jgi:hypothetical protein
LCQKLQIVLAQKEIAKTTVIVNDVSSTIKQRMKCPIARDRHFVSLIWRSQLKLFFHA